MLDDLKFILIRWRLIHLLGALNIKGRYARSILGQLWLTLSVLLLILSTGLVWSLIWKQPIQFFLPYVGIGQVIYLFVAATINESAGVIVADQRLYVSEHMPCTVSIATHIYKNLLMLAHNVPIIIGLIIWSHAIKLTVNIYYVPSFIATVIFLFFMSYIIATICTRFRDLIQLVASIMQASFLITPVMWNLTVIPQKYHFYVLLNPFASCLEILRNPLIGLPIEPVAYKILLAWTVISGLTALIVHKTMEKNTIFWI